MGEGNNKLQNKKKAFEEDPHKFIHIDDVIIGAIQSEKDGAKGIKIFISNAVPRLILNSCAMQMQYELFKKSNMEDAVALANKAKDGIVVPKNRIEGL